MGTTQIELYNLALLNIGERSLASTSEDRPPRYALDAAYAPAKALGLENGIWSFALKGTTETQDGAGSYGKTYYFTKPTDLVHTFTLSTQASFAPVLDHSEYVDEARKWHASHATLYVRYVSNDAAYGGDLTLWPQAYTNYVAALLARMVCYRLTSNEALFRALIQLEGAALDAARAAESLRFPPGSEQFNYWARFRGEGAAKQTQASQRQERS